MKIQVKENIYWIGVNDRETKKFENTISLDKGVAYNSYVIDDEKIAIIDAVKFTQTSEFLDKIKEVIGDRQPDYLVINHMEPDHSSSIADVIKEYPNIQVVGNKKTLPFIKGFYGIEPNFLEVKEGDEIDLGKRKISFIMTPMIHWPESMMTYESTLGVLFSMDAFGSFGANNGGVFDDTGSFDEDEMRRYYANIVAKYSPLVVRAIDKLGTLKISVLAPSHGLCWRKNPMKPVELYKKWASYQGDEGVVIVFGTMYGNTGRMADALANALAEEGIKEIKIHDVSNTDMSHIISDMWKYRGIALGSVAYNTKLYPPMDALVRKLSNTSLSNRYLAIFGNKSWSGGGVSALNAFAEEMGWEKVGESVEATYAPHEKEFEALKAIAKELAAKVKR